MADSGWCPATVACLSIPSINPWARAEVCLGTPSMVSGKWMGAVRSSRKAVAPTAPATTTAAATIHRHRRAHGLVVGGTPGTGEDGQVGASNEPRGGGGAGLCVGVDPLLPGRAAIESDAPQLEQYREPSAFEREQRGHTTTVPGPYAAG